MNSRRTKKATAKWLEGRCISRREILAVRRSFDRAKCRVVRYEWLGFVEDSRLADLHWQAVAAIRTRRPDLRRAAMNAYLDAAEAAVDRKGDENYERALAQIGLILAQAKLWAAGGEPVQWLANLVDAYRYAVNLAQALRNRAKRGWARTPSAVPLARLAADLELVLLVVLRTALARSSLLTGPR